MALILGLFSPWNAAVETFMSGAAADSPTTLTETITVRGFNGAAAANAQIFAWYSTGSNSYDSTTIALTNENGVGVLTIPQGSSDTQVDWTELQIWPSLADSSNAVYIAETFDRTTSHSMTVNLKRADIRVRMRNSNNDGPLPNYSSFEFPVATDEFGSVWSSQDGHLMPSSRYTLSVNKIRDGAFGVSLPEGLNVVSTPVDTMSIFMGAMQGDGDSAKKIYFLSTHPNSEEGSGSYFFMIFNDGTSRSVHVFNADNNMQEIIPSDGVFTLNSLDCSLSQNQQAMGCNQGGGGPQQQSGNLQIQLANPDLTPLSLPNGVSGNVRVWALDNTGKVDQAEMNNSRPSNGFERQGSALVQVDSSTTRQYLPVVFLSGSDSFPSFIGAPFWSHDGGFSATQNGTPVDSISVVLPNSGVKFTAHMQTIGGTAKVGYWNLNKAPNSQNSRYLGSLNSTSDATFLIPNRTGEYGFYIGPDDPAFASTFFKINTGTDSDTFTVTDLSGHNISLSDVGGVKNFTIQVRPINFSFFISAPGADTPDTASAENGAQYSEDGNNWLGLGSTEAGEFSAGLAPGTYRFSINPGPGNSSYSSQDFTVVVGGNGAVSSVRDAANVAYTPNGSGKYILPFQASNFFFNIVNPAGTTVLNSWFDYCEYDPDQKPDQTNCKGGSGSGINLDSSKTYKLRIHGPNGSPYAEKEFIIVVGGNGTVSSVKDAAEVAYTPDGSGVYALALEASNLVGVIKDAAGQALPGLPSSGGRGINVNLEKWTTDQGGGHWEWTGGTWSEDGTFGLRVSAAGKYRIHATPRGVGDYTEGFSGDILVSNADSITVISSSGETRTSIVVKLPTPNFKMIVNNPLTSAGLTSGSVQIDAVNGQNRSGFANVNLDPSSPGLGSAKLLAGTYVATVYPWGNSGSFITGLASKTYNISVSAELAITVVPSGSNTPLTPNGDGKFVLEAAAANLSGHLVNSSGNSVGSSNTRQINLTLWKLRSDGVNWDWITWANADRDGFFSVFVDTQGTYRLKIEPYGDNSYAPSYTPSFTISGASDKLNLGDLVLAAPTLRVRVTAPALPAVAYTGIEIRRNNQFVDWAGTGTDGIASISLTQAGKYDLIVNPSNDNRYANYTRKTYSITINMTDGVASATYDGSPVTSTLDLALGSATLTGFVYAPNGSTPIGNTQVVAVDQVTGQEMWMNSANTGQSTGAWAMSLPDGRYKLYARAPWGDATYANSNLSSVITVASGNASPSSTLNISLQSPKWKGTVKGPSGNTGIANASVCLAVTVSFTQSWNCTNTDDNGLWAINPPSGFSAFNNNDRLEVRENFNPQYSNLLVTTNATLTSTLPLAGSDTITLRLPIPNTSITVVAPNGQSTANLWINLDAPNVGWLGGAATNAQGVARFNLANPAQAISARVDLNGNAELGGTYAVSTLNIAAVGGRTTISDTLTLTLPNLRGVVKDPATGSVLPYTWVDLIDKSTNRGLGGANTDSNGFFALNAPAPTSGTTEYQVTVNPPWNGSSSSTRKTYTLVVQTNGTAVLTDANSGSSVPTETYGSGLAYSMKLASPSITGVVKLPDGTTTVANSWITPTLTSTGETKWQLGSNSRNDGSFGLAVEDGIYTVEANVPWGTSGVAKSATCSVTVAGGRVTNALGGCIVTGPSVELKLRSPNLSFAVTNATDTALAYTHVGIQIGNWYTDAQTDVNGNVGIFLSHNDFTAASTGLTAGTTQKIHLVVDPPYGNSDVVRLDCNSGDVGTPCATLPSVTIGGLVDPSDLSITVKLAAPNTRLRVLAPNGTAVGQGAWVSLLAVPKSNVNTRIWVGGSVTDSSGWATFNIDTSTIFDTFTVEVNAPWDQRQTYSTKSYVDTTFASINNNSSTFRLAAPNLVLKVLASGGAINKWGWVGVELVDGNNSSWIGGYGVDEKGGVALSLAPNTGSAYYRVTSNPGPGKSGARTVCNITNTSGTLSRENLPGCGAISAGSETITLNAGNVTGRVTATAGGTAIPNAIVYANLSDTATATEATSLVTATDADGNYGLQLDTSKSWIIKIFPANDDLYADGVVAAFRPTDNTTKNVALATK